MKTLWVALLLAIISIPANAEESAEKFTSFFGFALRNNTLLAQVQKVLGSAYLVETGDGGEYDASICYQAKDGFIQFQSGEMGGPQHELLGFSISKKAPNNHCSKLAKKFFSRSLDLAGLHLGMSQNEFTETVGEKIQPQNGKFVANFDYRRPVTLKEHELDPVIDYADVSISVQGRFSDNHLIAFSTWKIITF